MTARSLQTQVAALLGRRLVEDKVAGVASPDVEGSALFESITLALLLEPQAVLYLAHLARNGLLRHLQLEREQLEALSRLVDDSANPTYLVNDTQALEEARRALLQLERLEKPDPGSGPYRRFDTAVSVFLEQQLSKSVRRPGRSEMVRPGAEAQGALPAQFSLLKEAHEELLERLYALAVGVDNYATTPFGTLLGLSTTSRVRSDLEALSEALGAGSTAAQEAVLRLVAGRAALKSVGRQVASPASPVARTHRAVASPASVRLATPAGPFVLPAGATLNGQPFPLTWTDLNNRPALVSAPLTFPLALPAGHHLFLDLRLPDGSWLQLALPLVAYSYTNPAHLTLMLTTALGSYGSARMWGDRLVLILEAAEALVDIAVLEQQPGGTYLPLTTSAHALLGLAPSQRALGGSTPASLVVHALNVRFGSTLAARALSDGQVEVVGLESAPGASLSFSGSALEALGLPAQAQAMSDTLELEDASGLGPGDGLQTPTGHAFVESVSGQLVRLDRSLPTFEGEVQAYSVLAEGYRTRQQALETWLDVWGSHALLGPLRVLEAPLAALTANPTAANRLTVQRILTSLQELLESLEGTLRLGAVPPGAARQERKTVEGLLTSLRERKYDRAHDLLLRLQVQEALMLPPEGASYGGELVRAMSAVAKASLVFPTTDEQGSPALTREDG